MALRILALVTDGFGAGGGIAQYNRDLICALAATDKVQEIVILARHGTSATDNIPPRVQQLPACKGRLLFALQALRVLHRQGRFDVIFCGHLYMAPLAALMSAYTGIPLWLQVHGIEAWQCPGPMQRWAAEQAQLVTAVSRHTRTLFLQWANSRPEVVRVLPNTVDERFTPGPADPVLLERYALHGHKVLLTVARLSAAERYKGHDRVLHALAELRAAHPELVYVIAGDGDDLYRLEQLARTLGVAGQVRFIGYVPDRDLPALFRTADLFVMPSLGEGFGIVFLQALATGLPVIGGDSDGSRDPLRDGRDGALVAASDNAAIAGTIATLLARSSKKAATTTFARAAFVRHVQRMTEELPVFNH